ncbi:MAG: T9SS type A sorting domain-containing protein [Sphingobacteriales bacterium]|nr:MAG: T9SS type A sorting domain-containing protein [Sphingobacteriales bacterium]
MLIFLTNNCILHRKFLQLPKIKTDFMKKLLPLLICGIFTLISNTAGAQTSPTFTWAVPEVFNTTSSFNGSQSVVAADQYSGVAFASVETWAENYNPYSLGTLQLRHYLANGTSDWNKIFTGKATVGQMRYAANGNLYITGHYRTSVEFGAQYSFSSALVGPQAYIACFDNAGNTLWAIDMGQQFGPTLYTEGLATDAQSNVYFASCSGANLSTANVVSIRKFSPTGQPLATIQQSANDISSLDVDPLGNVYVTGSCLNNNGATFGGVHYNHNVSGNGYNRYLVRYRPNGIPAWVKFSGDVTCPIGEVKCNGAQGAYWIGELLHDATFDNITLTGPANGGTWDYMLARLDTAGNYVWVKEVATQQNTGAGILGGHCMEVDAAGNVTITGTQTGEIAWGNGVSSNATGNYDPMMVRYNPAGTVLWAKVATNPNTHDFGYSLSNSPDGSVYLTGMTKGTLTLDALTITNPNATINYNFLAKLSTGVVNTAEALIKPALSVFPNPATECITVTIDGTVQQIEVLDLLGRVCITKGTASRESIVLPLAGLQAGTYLIRTSGKEGSQSAIFHKAE